MATTNSHDCRAPPRSGQFKGPVVPLSSEAAQETSYSSELGSRVVALTANLPVLAGSCGFATVGWTRPRGLTPAAPAPPLAGRPANSSRQASRSLPSTALITWR